MITTSISDLPPDLRTCPDLLIIGGGTVGLHAAVLASRAGFRVLVIEAGSQELGGFAPSTFRSVGRRHDGIRVGRSRSLGGTSNLWGGQLVEFQPADIGGRSWITDSKWPLTFEEIAAHHGSTYSALGIPRRWQSDAPVWEGVSTTVPNLSRGLELFLTRWMQVPNISKLYAHDIQRARGSWVLVGATVVGFVGDEGQVTGVRVVAADQVEHVLRARQFVLAAGTFETNRLLLWGAADGRWNCPWRGNQSVGLGFHDHLGGRIGEIHELDPGRFRRLFSTIALEGHKFQPKIRFTNSTLESESLLNVQGMIGFESSVSEQLVYLKQFLKAAVFSRRIEGVGQFVRSVLACSKYLLPLMWTYARDHRIFVPNSAKVALIIQAEQRVLRSSRLSLDMTSRDSFGIPRLVLDWQVDGRAELLSIREFGRRCHEALQAAGIAEVRLDPALEAADPEFLGTLRDTNHQCGGAIMANSEADGVVDRNLRVFGTNNLYILGPAVFRTTSNANVTFMALCLATRLVQHLENLYATDTD
jgi:choline dehydrogenase-like flavoprotein